MQNARSTQRIDVIGMLDEDCTVGTHRQGGAQLLLAVARADRCHDDFGRLARFAQPQCFFQSDFVEGVDAHLDPVGYYAGVVRLYTDADVIVDHTLDAN